MLTRARGLLSLLLLMAWPAFAQAPAPIELKLSHYLPPNHTIHKVLEEWGRDLEQRSGGRLTLRIYPAGQLGPVQRQFDLARNGQADLAVGLTGATPGRYPLTEVSNLPFVHPAAGSGSAVTSRRLTELGPKYLAREFPGLHLLWLGVTPPSAFFTSKREIASIADLRGLKVRFQGEQHAKILRELGAVPLQVPPAQITDDLSKGVIDGALFNYEGGESFGIGAVTRHVAEPAIAPASLIFVMNGAKYDGLPADLRAILDATTGPDAAEVLGRRWDAAEAHGREAMLASKVQINTFAPAELKRLQDTLAPLVQQATEQLTKDGKPGPEFLAEYTK